MSRQRRLSLRGLGLVYDVPTALHRLGELRLGNKGSGSDRHRRAAESCSIICRSCEMAGRNLIVVANGSTFLRALAATSSLCTGCK
jgi:hypothetical protein